MQHMIACDFASFSHNLVRSLQPLHVGFTSDRGGNEIDVHWFTRKQNLHHVSLIANFICLDLSLLQVA